MINFVVMKHITLIGAGNLATQGSMSIDCFKDSVQRYGVFYPMQTFSKTKNVSFENIPIFIEGNSEAVEEDIRTLAESITKRVISLSSEKRKYLHLAAVWACNFTNHCYSIASDILSEQGIPFDVMLPLIDETTNKIHTMSPLQAQTGPAVRWDQNVIDKQMALMESHPSLQAIYERLSNDIHSHNK